MPSRVIEEMLAILKGKSAKEQLQQRWIGVILKKDYPDKVRGQLITFTIPSRGYMEIELNAHDPVEEWLMTVVHELGHTFEFGVLQDGKLIPLEFTPRVTRKEKALLKNSPDWRINARVAYYHRRREEKVCEEFANAWLQSENNYQELRKLLMPLITQVRIDL